MAGPEYYAWKGYNAGKAISLGAVEQAEANVYGMHGYPTAKEAEAKPNSVNLVERPQVSAWVVAANNITGNPVKDAKKATQQVADATGLTSVEGFLKGLTNVNLWLRVAKVLVGGAIVIVGIAHMTGFDKGIVGTAVKAAPLL